MTTELKSIAAKKIEEKSVGAVLQTPAPVDTADHKAKKTDNAVPVKRLQTWGETKFNILNYGGFALIGNEIGGTWLTKQAENGMFKNIYAKFAEKFTRHANNPLVPKYASSGRMPMIFVAIISGNFMVPFIKYFEDRKGEIVRRMDRKHYGEKSETDPALIAAHKEMDEAPKQSWGSLWKGRVSTMLTAFAIDSLIGWKDAPTTKILKNNATYQRFASYDRIAESFSEGAAKIFNISSKNKATFVEWTSRGVSLLTLSTVLTVLFYVTSKIFAKKRDEKIERRTHGGNELSSAETPNESIREVLPETALAKTTERPEAKIASISRESTVASSPQHLAPSH